MSRDHVVSVRFSDREHADIANAAQYLGVSVSDFIRRACAAESDILRQQRAIRLQRLQDLTLPQGETLGNVFMPPIEVTYVG